MSNVRGPRNPFNRKPRKTESFEKFDPEFRERHIRADFTGYLVARDTFLVGTLKGIGKIYLQTVVECYSRFAF